MSKFSGTQTEKNIKAAFQGESLARSRYTIFEDEARKEGNEEIAALFAKMAKNESFHAKLWYKLMMDGVDSTENNLKNSAAGEQEEWYSMYPGFAQAAREEGFDDVAVLFEHVAKIEQDHEATFLKAFIDMISHKSHEEKIADRNKAEQADDEKATVYRCMFCGAIYNERPDVCAVCGAIGSFEVGEA